LAGDVDLLGRTMMVSIAVQKVGRARSAARHRERTEARLPSRPLPQSTTRTSGYANRSTHATTAVNGDHAVVPHGPALGRQGNEMIRAVIRTQGHQLVPFFCECSDAACCRALWLALADYDRQTLAGETILVDGHAC
jgi:hypothetical protein